MKTVLFTVWIFGGLLVALSGVAAQAPAPIIFGVSVTTLGLLAFKKTTK